MPSTTMKSAPNASWGMPGGGMSILLVSSFFSLTRPTSVSSAASRDLKRSAGIQIPALLATLERLWAGLVHIVPARLNGSELHHGGSAQPNRRPAVQRLSHARRHLDVVDERMVCTPV